MSETITCSKCSGEMLRGRIVEFTSRRTRNQTWVQGEIAQAWLKELANPSSQQREVVTYCCSQCGYLESYGQPVE